MLRRSALNRKSSLQRSPFKKKATRPKTNANHGKYRNREYLNLCKKLDCQNCGRYKPSDPAHSNWSEWGGKGERTKATDGAIAALCRQCHDWLDHGPARRSEKQEMWLAAAFKTAYEFFVRGWVVPAPGERLTLVIQLGDPDPIGTLSQINDLLINGQLVLSKEGKRYG